MSAGEQLPPVAPSDGGSVGGSSIDELQVRQAAGVTLWLQCYTKPLGELTRTGQQEGQFRHLSLLPSVILHLFRNVVTIFRRKLSN